MYALGDKYDIPSLKTQACASFTKRIDELGALPLDFVDVYRAVVESTPVGDTGLRGALARVCALHVEQIGGGGEEEEGKWVEALEGDGRMVLEVLRRVGRRGELGKRVNRGDLDPLSGYSWIWDGPRWPGDVVDRRN